MQSRSIKPAPRELQKKTLSGLKELEAKVKKAKLEKKIFILTLRYEGIRQGLSNRNWLEKVADEPLGTVTPGSDRLKIAMLLKNSPFNFIWQSRNRAIKPLDNSKPYINSIWRQRQFDFTTKDGLTSIANSFHWNYIEDVTDLNYQRTHVLTDKISRDEFLEDFRCTIFTSFILFLDTHEDIRLLFSKTGHYDMECVDYAIQKVDLLIKYKDHDDIDTSSLFDVCARFPKNQRVTMDRIMLIINGKKKFRYEEPSIALRYKELVKLTANKILDRWPYLRYDGYKNLWIFKPVGNSSGNGVRVLNDEEKIKTFLHTSKMTTHVAQKYIERPMIIYSRKFDIRIYFLTFIRNKKFHVWVYKDCYIKFATHPFNCDNLGTSIHVTNYAVQKFFMNDSNSVPGAVENMWTLSQYIDYLQTIDKPRLWETKIYPAIKKNLLAVILPSLEGTDLDENNFELNGADFMIGYDHQPILIEINSMPALFFSKTVQDLITTKLQDDVLKVVVDHTSDPNAYVGDFELIHTEEIYNESNTLDLTIQGKKLDRILDRSRFKDMMMKMRENSKVSPLIDDKIEYVTNDGTKFIYIKAKT